MQNIDKHINITARIILLWLAALFVIMLLKGPMDNLIIKYSIYFNFDNVVVKILYTAIVLILSVYFIRNLKTANSNYLINSSCLCLIYFLFRYDIIEHTDWDFVSILGSIYYTDYVWLFLIICIYPHIKSNDKSTSTLPQFSDNNPIVSLEKDAFGYATDAAKLLRLMVNNRQRAENGAIIIGLIGKWGQGKTSYLNMMSLSNSDKKNVILIRINIWQSRGYEDMAKHLLSAIADEVGDITLKGLINDYTKVIINADIPYLSKLFALFKGDRPKQPEILFKSVGEKIKALNKTLIVQVDDIDRLTAEEMLDALKLIRNVVGFSNTFFIVAYDDEYIKRCFNKIGIETSYLEKLINIPYPLPSVRRDKYIDIIRNELVSSLLLVDSEVERAVDRFLTVIGDNISLRNTKRLISSIQCGITDLKDGDGEIMVDFLDYMLVQFLQQVNSKAYDFLASYHDDEHFIKTKCIKIEGSQLSMNMTKGFGPNKQELTDEEYKKERLIRDVGDENLDLTYQIFQELFDYNRDTITGLSYVNSFPLYFTRQFNKQLICKKDYLNSFRSGVNQFRLDLDNWYHGYDTFTLDCLIAYQVCTTAEEWEQLFDSVLSLTPLSFISSLLSREHGFVPQPGLKAIKSGSREEKKLFYQTFDKFFLNVNRLQMDTIENIQKKLAFILYNYLIYFNQSLALYIERPIGNKYLFELYWEQYLNKGVSYKDFDEDFWYLIDQTDFQEKVNLRNIAKDHIAENIEEFIVAYPIEQMSNYYYLHSLFTNYELTGKNSAQGNDNWIPGFRQFLNAITPKSSALSTYINDFEKYVETIYKAK